MCPLTVSGDDLELGPPGQEVLSRVTGVVLWLHHWRFGGSGPRMVGRRWLHDLAALQGIHVGFERGQMICETPSLVQEGCHGGAQGYLFSHGERGR